MWRTTLTLAIDAYEVLFVLLIACALGTPCNAPLFNLVLGSLGALIVVSSWQAAL
jgi:hypothetical protein